MRHTFALIMDDRGLEDQLIADLLGHKNVTTFQRIYRHRLRPLKAKVNMNDLFRKRNAA
ncbi:MAG TPA: tyrosine-type recombinase/integrase [Streptosporangiaceae bacterium]